MRYPIANLLLGLTVTISFVASAQDDRNQGGVSGVASSGFQTFEAKSGLTASSIQQAELRRLFSDPHFNRINDMNIDIAEFGNFEPISPQMLKSMDQAQVLGLVDRNSAITSTVLATREQPSAIAAQTVDSSKTRPFEVAALSVSTADLKRFFADPHFNQVSDMNIDVADFANFESIPPAMMLAMDQARVLGLADGKTETLVARLAAQLEAAPPAAGLKFGRSRDGTQSAVVDWVDGSSEKRR